MKPAPPVTRMRIEHPYDGEVALRFGSRRSAGRGETATPRAVGRSQLLGGRIDDGVAQFVEGFGEPSTFAGTSACDQNGVARYLHDLLLISS